MYQMLTIIFSGILDFKTFDLKKKIYALRH